MSEHDHEEQSHELRSFGRRRGRKPSDRQAALKRDLLPRVALDLSLSPLGEGQGEGAVFNFEEHADFPSPLEGVPPSVAAPQLPLEGEGKPLWLEIGFGGGEHLVAEALAFPDTGFIGCEPYVNGMAKILTQIEAHNIANIRLFAGDAVELLAWVPPRSLARIDLIHPDPWPKRRHWKRRFVQDATVAAMARAIRPGGEFRFVSDIDDYSAWTLAHFQRADDFVWTAERAGDWNAPWPGFTKTRYGAKAEREGRRATYLAFRRR